MGTKISGLLIGAGIAGLLWWVFFEPGDRNLKGAARGEYLLGDLGCRACHQEDSGFRAPVIDGGIIGQPRPLTDGRRLVIDEAYVRRALLDPAADIAEGYGNTMPAYPDIDDADFADLMAWFRFRPAAPAP